MRDKRNENKENEYDEDEMDELFCFVGGGTFVAGG